MISEQGDDPSALRSPHGSAAAKLILSNTGYRAAADVASKVISIVLFVAIGRMLGTEGFGYFVFGMAFAEIVTVFAAFGQDQILTREVARDHDRIHAYFFNTLLLKATLAVPLLLGGFGLLVLEGTSPTAAIVSLVLAVAILLSALTFTCYSVFWAYERMAYFPIIIVLQRLTTTSVAVVGMMSGLGVVFVAVAFLLGELLALTLATTIQYRRIVRPRFEVDVRRWAGLLRAAAPVGVAILFSVVIFRAGILILASFESKQVAGEYGAAMRLFETMLFLGTAVAMAAYPAFSRLTQSSTPTIRFVFERVLKLALAVTLPLVAFSLIGGGDVLTLLYGAEFEGAYPILVVLSPAIAFYAIQHVAALLLVSQDRPRLVTWVFTAGAIVAVGGSLALTPVMSARGTALATTAAECVLAVAALTFAARVIGGLSIVRAAAGPTVATIAAAGGMLLVQDRLLAVTIVGAAAYMMTLVAFERSMFPDDFDVVWQFAARRGRS